MPKYWHKPRRGSESVAVQTHFPLTYIGEYLMNAHLKRLVENLAVAEDLLSDPTTEDWTGILDQQERRVNAIIKYMKAYKQVHIDTVKRAL